MAYSSGARGALHEAGYWLVLASCGIAGIVYFDEIKNFTRAALDISAPSKFSSNTSGTISMGAPPSSSTAVSAGGTVVLTAGSWGQYRTAAEINGLETTVLVDTGASAVALTAEAAESAGIYLSPSDYSVRVRTANGIGHVASVVLDSVTIGNITVRDVRAFVHKPGTLGITLLGMTFLSKLARVSIRGKEMILEE